MNTDGPTSTVILIGDSGTGAGIPPDGTTDPDHTSQLELKLTAGTVRIDIAGLHSTFAPAFQEQFPSHAASCSGHVTAHATAPIVAGSGTGAYGHAQDTLDLTITVDEVDKTNMRWNRRLHRADRRDRQHRHHVTQLTRSGVVRFMVRSSADARSAAHPAWWDRAPAMRRRRRASRPDRRPTRADHPRRHHRWRPPTGVWASTPSTATASQISVFQWLEFGASG